jgi:membrane protease YdiL (CAAX protease family)
MSILVITYLLYCLVARWVYQAKADKLLYPGGATGNSLIWNMRHLAGIALLFVCPVFLSEPSIPLLQVGTYRFPVLVAIVVAGYVLFNLSIITGLNLPQPAGRLMGEGGKCRVSILLRAVFLACYEYYFRGLFLFTVAEQAGFFFASFISTALYSISHFGDERRELIATIPFGFFLCWVTIETKSILPAILLHWFIALPGEIIASNKIVQLTQKKLS